jgi:hypothetical protein
MDLLAVADIETASYFHFALFESGGAETGHGALD